MTAAGAAHISCAGGETFAADAACAALDALRGARVVAIHFSEVDDIPASDLSHHPSLTRLDFQNSLMPPLRNLAGYTQLHGLRQLTYVDEYDRGASHQLQHAQPLSQLEVLDVEGMQTEGADVDMTLEALPRLRELGLNCNSDLRTVPASMASLTRLTRLSLSYSEVSNGWQHLPLQLELLELKSIDGLSSVPPELSRLSRLTELDLSVNLELAGCSLQVLVHLSSLRKLGLHYCRLGDAAIKDVALPMTLQSLDLSINSLTAVPAALAPLTGLTGLSLGYNQLAGGWKHLAGMQQLASLRVTHCSLAAVPQVFSQLTALTSLDMSDNSIASGWQHLAGMQQLEGLHVRKCGLTAVPQVLSQLTDLTSLNMNDNPVASGWQHLSLLPLLRELETDDPAHRIPLISCV